MNIFYNALHSPIGAHASFTLGCKGAKGGLGLELGKPADQNMYIGLESSKPGVFKALPFFEHVEDESSRYDHEKSIKKSSTQLIAFKDNQIKRKHKLGEDTWRAGELSFTIYSPVKSAPDPNSSTFFEQKAAYCPAILAELTIDNRKGKSERKAFVGYTKTQSTDALRTMDNLPKKFKGIAVGNSTAMVTDDAAIAAQDFTINGILSQPVEKNYRFALGNCAALLFNVPAGEIKTFRMTVCFFRGGIVTSGVATSYWYYRFFKSIEDVARFSLKNYRMIKKSCADSCELVAEKKLNAEQYFQFVHAAHSYYGSTQLLDWNGKPFWVVNEGEYRMMNTFDLTVDHLFFEMKLNPWTVRNELDFFTSRYSYIDKVHGSDGRNKLPGGISFTHDMGVCNHISIPRYSTYEQHNLSGCFSHMTHEQLVNWVLCAAVYAKLSGDRKWLKKNIPVFVKCLSSQANRDSNIDSKRNGIMSLDSSRTMQGAEITTYDSLDQSLGQARNNVYIAVKGWAAYLAMEEVFNDEKMTDEADFAFKQARRAASTIVSHFDSKEGYIPAVMGENCKSKIIPAIEGLVFPYILNQKKNTGKTGRFSELYRKLEIHLKNVLRDGVCLYPDGGWKLSSSADNSWLSKIYLCQFIARKIFGYKNRKALNRADKAHVKWLTNSEDSCYWSWSDQMRSGVPKGSKYYPRGVTSILWLDE